uniref:Exonuclease domain-containing protein n=1 Tax=Periophthalmus magnuspinnatus TaxID=409849 RepID=A0A3B4AS84_9GOBI
MPITDYRTRWSGIRKSDLYGAMPYDQARKEILKLLVGKVLIGHAIHNDLRVLNYNHPKALIRDTSRIPLLNAKAGFPEHQPASLKRLTKAIFNQDIQTGRKGHSSVEDAKATMELYKVIEVEWERKMASTALVKTFHRLFKSLLQFWSDHWWTLPYIDLKGGANYTETNTSVVYSFCLLARSNELH